MRNKKLARLDARVTLLAGPPFLQHCGSPSRVNSVKRRRDFSHWKASCWLEQRAFFSYKGPLNSTRWGGWPSCAEQLFSLSTGPKKTTIHKRQHQESPMWQYSCAKKRMLRVQTPLWPLAAGFVFGCPVFNSTCLLGFLTLSRWFELLTSYTGVSQASSYKSHRVKINTASCDFKLSP